MGNRKVIYLDDAIDALERKKDKKAKGDIGGFYNKIIQNDIDALMQLPSVQPKRKTGKWNFIGENMFECTSCGVVYTTEQLNGLRNYDTDPYAPKFCPNCGADMREKYERLD